MLKNLGIAMLLLWPQIIFANTINVTLHYIGPTDGQVWAGIQQGLTEANLQGQFLGQAYDVKNITEEEVEALPASEITAVLVGTDAKHMLEIAKLNKLTTVPVFNLSSDADSLRQVCLPNLLNIPLSKQMKQDALAQWQNKNPDKLVTAHAWHHDFVKFAASQLNNRFTRNHKTQMTDDAWAGWAAIKMLSDTVARTQKTDSAAMLNYLKKDLSFDGQKGDTATFRDTGQLRQIVLLIDKDDNIVAEAPLRGVKGGLDSLGLISCK